METHVETTIAVTNHRSTSVQCIIEPWGDAYPLHPRETFRVVFTSDVPGEAEIAVEDAAITVYAWTGCAVAVYKRDGTLLRS